MSEDFRDRRWAAEAALGHKELAMAQALKEMFFTKESVLAMAQVLESAAGEFDTQGFLEEARA